MAELILDDPAWTYRTGTGPSTRRLRVWQTEPGRLAAVVTENLADEGMSITNAAAVILSRLREQYPDHVTTVFEHYADPHGPRGEHFDEVWIGDMREGQPAPKWRAVPLAEMIMLLGVDPSTVAAAG